MASALGRDVLVRSFMAVGLDEEAAEDSASALTDDFASAGMALQGLNSASLDALFAALEDVVEQLGADAATQAMVELALRSSETQSLGWGKDVQQAALGIGIALTLFVKIAGTSFDYSPEHGVTLTSPAGLAPGIEQTVEKIADVVSEALKLAQDRVPRPTAVSGRETSRRLPVTREARQAAVVPYEVRQRIITLSNGNRCLSREEDAVAVAQALRNELGRSYELPFYRPGDEAQLYWSQQGRVPQWDREHPFSLDTGVYAVKGADDVLVYRIAVQVQTPTNIRRRALERIRNELKQIGDNLVSVRAVTREVKLLDGDLPAAWLKMVGGLGGPLALRGGAVGTSGLYVQSEDRSTFVLTAGHVLTDLGHRAPAGDIVYSPPLMEEGGNGRIGIVHQASEFTASCRTREASSDVDIGAVLLDVDQVPKDDRRSGVDGYRLQLEVAPVTADLIDTTVYKAPSRTRRAVARVRAVGVSVSITNPRTRRCIRGDGLILASLDRKAPAVGGESGTLVYDADHRPLGLVVAGSDSIQLQDGRGGTTRPLIYIQPLASYLASRGWRPF